MNIISIKNVFENVLNLHMIFTDQTSKIIFVHKNKKHFRSIIYCTLSYKS